jgi:hypothetical protein
MSNIRAEGVAQCLPCTRPWIQSPATKIKRVTNLQCYFKSQYLPKKKKKKEKSV